MSIKTSNIQLSTINSLPYPQAGGFLPNPVANKILRTNTLTPAWGDVNPNNIAPGTARQLLQTGASTPEWTSDIEVSNINVITNIQCNGSTGDVGYVIQRNTDNSGQEWVPKNVLLKVARVDDYDINSGDEFMRNGEVQFSQGSSFKFVGDGTFVCLRSDYYLFIINGRFDTFNGQSKLRIIDGTNKYGVSPLMYIPGVTEIQSWSTSIVLRAEVDQVFSFAFERYGVAGTINTIFKDPDYGNLTCSITILG